jgi:hypothetical protein
MVADAVGTSLRTLQGVFAEREDAIGRHGGAMARRFSDAQTKDWRNSVHGRLLRAVAFHPCVCSHRQNEASTMVSVSA